MVVTSFVYVASYCEDVEGDFLKYHVVRTGIRKYTISKLCISFSASFLAMGLGTIGFLIYKSAALPLVVENGTSILNFKPINCFGFLLPNRVVWFMGIQVCLHGLYCASMGVLALALSTFVKNSYGVYVLPFLLNYCLFYLFSEISAEYPMLCIEMIYNSSSATYTDTPLLLVGYAIFVTGIWIVLSYFIMYKRIRRDFS